MSPRDARAIISWKKKTERPRDRLRIDRDKEKKTEKHELGGDRQTERQKSTERPKLTPHGRYAGPQGPANKVSC